MLLVSGIRIVYYIRYFRTGASNLRPRNIFVRLKLDSEFIELSRFLRKSSHSVNRITFFAKYFSRQNSLFQNTKEKFGGKKFT